MSRDRNERDQEHHAGEKFGRHPICQIRPIMALTYILYVKICIFQLFFQKKLPATNVTNLRLINPKSEYRNPKQYQNSNVQNSKQKHHLRGKNAFVVF